MITKKSMLFYPQDFATWDDECLYYADVLKQTKKEGEAIPASGLIDNLRKKNLFISVSHKNLVGIEAEEVLSL